jgi:adenosine deaminase
MIRIKSFVLLFSLFLLPIVQAQVVPYFNQIRSNPSKLYSFFKKMPKGGELHYHLAGGSSPETMLSVASTEDYCLNKATLAVSKITSAECDGIKIKDLEQHSSLYSKVVRSWSMQDFIPVKESGHDHFFNGFDKYMPIVLNKKPQLIADIITRATQQEELYLELLDIPDDTKSLAFSDLIQNIKPWDDKRRLLLANKKFQKNIDLAVSKTDKVLNQAREELGCVKNPQLPACNVQVKIIYYALREQPSDKLFVQALTAFESVSRSKGNLAGVNLVQPEDGVISLRDYHHQMQIYGYLHALYPHVPISLHAGELSHALASPQDLSFHIQDALYTGKAKRIGHGVDIAFEDNPDRTLKYMAKEHIAVEINLISNLKILNIAGHHHPLNYYLKNKVPVVLSTDDEGVLRTDLTHQFVEAALNHNLDYPTLKQINRNTLTYAFLPGKSIWANANKGNRVGECFDLDSKACKLFIEQNEKAKLQWTLEKKLLVFENGF